MRALNIAVIIIIVSASLSAMNTVLAGSPDSGVNPPVNYTEIENLTPGTNMTSEEAGVWTTLTGPITWIQELFKVFIYTALLGSTIDGLIQQAVGVGLPQSMVYLFNAISSISIVFAIFQLLFNRSLGGME